MSLFPLDTDWIIDRLHLWESAIRTIESLTPAGLAIGLVTDTELYEGAYYARDSDQALAAMATSLAAKDVMSIP